MRIPDLTPNMTENGWKHRRYSESTAIQQFKNICGKIRSWGACELSFRLD